MERFKTYSRLTGDDRFRRIAADNLHSFNRLQPQVLEIRSKISKVLSSCADPEEPTPEYYSLRIELDPIEEARDQACIIVVVFTAMYFEAFIYDYSASCLGDRYSRAHLDKLDFISKWLIIPKLVTGKEILKSGQAYEALKRLHKDRNSLVHLKSRSINFDQDTMSKHLTDRENKIEQSVANCELALKCVIAELQEIDPDHPKVQLAGIACSQSMLPTNTSTD